MLIIPLHKGFRIETENLDIFTMTYGCSDNCSRAERDRELQTVDINKRNKLSKSRKLHFPMISANCKKVPRKVFLRIPHEVGCEFFKTCNFHVTCLW